MGHKHDLQNATDLSMVASGSTDPQTSKQPSEAAQDKASTAWVEDTNMVSSSSPARGHQHGLRWQHRLPTSTCLPAAARPMDINSLQLQQDLIGSTDHKHQHGFRWWHRTQTSAWPWVVTCSYPCCCISSFASLLCINISTSPLHIHSL